MVRKWPVISHSTRDTYQFSYEIQLHWTTFDLEDFSIEFLEKTDVIEHSESKVMISAFTLG